MDAVDGIAEAPAAQSRPGRTCRLGALLGGVSALLLGASFIWAHHWGPLADAIVVAWFLAWPSAVIVSARALARRDAGRNLARLGLLLSVVSLLALLSVGVAAAAGVDPSSFCGGG